MSSPWLFIPLEDYEGHMASPGVQQLSVLAELFKRAPDYCLPESVAVLGVASGNALEQVDYTATESVLDTLPQKCQKEIPEKIGLRVSVRFVIAAQADPSCPDRRGIERSCI